VVAPVTPAAPVPGKARGAGKTLRDMLLSIGVIMAIVGVVVVFQQRGGPGITVIDPGPAYAGARDGAHFAVRTPHVPRTWRPTSARTERSPGGLLTLRVGFITPTGQYAQLVESDLPRPELLGRELSAGVRPLGEVTVQGAVWQRLPGAQAGDRAIARTQGKVTYLVSGTAKLPELQALAGSLA